MDMSGFPPTVVRQKVPAACCEHLAGTAFGLADETRNGLTLTTQGKGTFRSHKGSPPVVDLLATQ